MTVKVLREFIYENYYMQVCFTYENSYIFYPTLFREH